MAIIIVCGSGDVGSAVAAVLCRAGHAVVLHDRPQPAHSRRGMAFSDALYHGSARLEELLAKRARRICDLPHMLRCGHALPVIDAPLEDVVSGVRPDVLVDARMRKRECPESQRGLAPLTIGLGPNFVAGGNVDVAVETAWGDDLGAVIRQGGTRPLAGEPMPISGHARDRYVYAPIAGVFSTRLNVGDAVVTGDEIGRIGDVPLHAPLSGCLRGITHDGALVVRGTKVLEVDPRSDQRAVFGLGERPTRIAEGVLKAVTEAQIKHAAQ